MTLTMMCQPNCGGNRGGGPMKAMPGRALLHAAKKTVNNLDYHEVGRNRALPQDPLSSKKDVQFSGGVYFGSFAISL